MDSTQNCTVDVQKLLHPELLSRSELLEILLSRCVQQQLLEGLEKDQLVDLFQRIVMPLPQRTYNNKRRGKMLTELRSKNERHLNCAENKTTIVHKSDKLGKISSVGDVSVEHERLASRCSKNSLDHIIVNDRRKMAKFEKDPSETADDAKNKSDIVVRLKRSDTNSSEKSSTSSNDEEEDKKKRRRIVWP